MEKAKGRNILIVEDNPDHAELATSAIQKYIKNCKVDSVTRSNDCFQKIQSTNYSAVVLDYSLDGFNGITVLKYIKEKNKDLPVLIVTGMGNEQIAVEAMKSGAYDYIVKTSGYLEMLPMVLSKAIEMNDSFIARREMEERVLTSELQYRTLVDNINIGVYRTAGGEKAESFVNVNNALLRIFGFVSSDEIMPVRFHTIFKNNEDAKAYFNDIDEKGSIKNKEYQMKKKDGSLIWGSISAKVHFETSGDIKWVDGTIEDITDRKRAEETLEESLLELKKVFNDMVSVLAATSEMRDSFTAGHQRRVAELACEIGREMGFSEERIEGIRMGALVHDIGKIHIPIEILSKPGKLSGLEFQLIKTHPEIGYDVLKNIKSPWPLAKMILQHHERADGSGYPKGLKGEEILLEARIISVSDVVEAMVSHRPYRPALGLEKALKEVSSNRGKLYDAKVVDACLIVFKRGFQFPT